MRVFRHEIVVERHDEDPCVDIVQVLRRARDGPPVRDLARVLDAQGEEGLALFGLVRAADHQAQDVLVDLMAAFVLSVRGPFAVLSEMRFGFSSITLGLLGPGYWAAQK